MAGPHPDDAFARNELLAAISHQQLPELAGIKPHLWVALSGGADSLALAVTTAWVAQRYAYPFGAIVVDHDLQSGSAAVAANAAEQAKSLGFPQVFIEKVKVATSGGMEAAARKARYQALENRVSEQAGGLGIILTGHTLDDQAESVLLALARGSGGRSLAGIPPRRGRIIRPFLRLRRTQTEAICERARLVPWQDPTNFEVDGPKRSAVRGQLIPLATEILGPAFSTNLARSAELLAADMAELEQQAQTALPQIQTAAGELVVAELTKLSVPILSRVIKIWAESYVDTVTSATQVRAIVDLVTNYRGQGDVYLPSGLRVRREYGKLVVHNPTNPGSSA